MPLQFYKPNSNNTGTACGFSFNSKDAALYISFIKQTSPKTDKSQGSFKGGKKCNTKFSIGEIGGLMRTLEKGTEFKGYHNFPGSSQVTTSKFAPYFVGEKKDVLKGIGLSVTKTDKEDSTVKDTFSVGFSLDEAVVVREYLRFVLNHVFTAIYSADKKAYEDSQKREDREKPKTETRQPAKKKEEAKSEPTEDDPFAGDPFEDGTVSQTSEGDEPESDAKPPQKEVTKPEEKPDKSAAATDNSQTDDDIF